MRVFYFIELAMMGREKRQHMDWTMLSLIDSWEDFISYDWGELIWSKAWIHEIELMDDERAYFDRSLEIPTTKGYEEGRHDPT
ncbi:hypothetical protein E6C27_scaffold468G001870 [Cucumis melo var. makuwa]|uniref:Ulp1-like peptidase n=1 Tax=Cucumis melo var. makuwa TaxID=1194695 RepID=A0A5A7V747_CUCMM|nr:hypothetical protein E6C27_scaffold468G001870 [Cucumis melo var. makuwa]